MLLLPFLALFTFASALATPNIPPASRRTAIERSLFGPGADQTAFLQAHNRVRVQHGAQNLVWNATLEASAQSWADSCQVKHSDGTLLSSPYGENIVAGTGQFSISDAVNQFTLDQGDYDPSNPTYLHFTQVVWKSTTQLGCAVSQCGSVFGPGSGLANYYVCIYDPAGNVIGEAPANVQV
ncbi:PR-1-like protein [Roridomyces roridus]|uniref:PR-1-like protein n=1 Tax=Roridomyces roridus TaxID=1738132 RepID=A0AAD7FU44_9AGAR|nr:PR-1-like protein [Roridomyces roridus]